jgi:hypothetical protein
MESVCHTLDSKCPQDYVGSDINTHPEQTPSLSFHSLSTLQKEIHYFYLYLNGKYSFEVFFCCLYTPFARCEGLSYWIMKVCRAGPGSLKRWTGASPFLAPSLTLSHAPRPIVEVSAFP